MLQMGSLKAFELQFPGHLPTLHMPKSDFVMVSGALWKATAIDGDTVIPAAMLDGTAVNMHDDDEIFMLDDTAIPFTGGFFKR